MKPAFPLPRTTAIAGAVLLAAASVPAIAAAQDPGQDTAILNGASFANAQGAITVNAAAGLNNQQANVAVIAAGDEALTAAVVIQALEESARGSARAIAAGIEGTAFANSSGLIAVNVAGGTDNQQGNLALISVGLSGALMTDAVLSQSRASQQPSDPSDPSGVVASVQTGLGEGTFENSSGIVQVSLIGGERNASSNIFALSMSGGAEP